MSETPSRATGEPVPPPDPNDPTTGPGSASPVLHRDPLTGTRSFIDQQLRNALRVLAPNLRRYSLSPGDRIYGVGANVRAVSLIERGLVALRSPGSATLMLLRDSGIVGDVEVMTETRAEKEATALLDTDIIRIPGDEFRWLIQRYPEFALRWTDAMACRMAGYERRLLDMLAGDLRAQISSLLLHEFADSDVTRLTHQMIAELLGVQRTSVSRVVSHLVQHDIVESGYGHMRLRDRNALARAALGYSTGSHT
ncbi:Crp/Fnr family transcriptional regulator [Saccharopolyspora rhizosphaerae]|uniref:Crp/Fnr family transcriptional regulator n=1 Tax=Saccharopolyspora rhizosphaerae TaxID=2492662 RepID=A0A426K5L4_9PSEU|nr:Crp/Fnr family transcriptional regulator [Saccharopolyspora rhizosphaerae]RRO20678.1 Crp/Fnr family transcriptional regulator [Saccharopolyspora rhizosphaerae]